MTLAQTCAMATRAARVRPTLSRRRSLEGRHSVHCPEPSAADRPSFKFSPVRSRHSPLTSGPKNQSSHSSRARATCIQSRLFLFTPVRHIKLNVSRHRTIDEWRMPSWMFTSWMHASRSRATSASEKFYIVRVELWVVAISKLELLASYDRAY